MAKKKRKKKKYYGLGKFKVTIPFTTSDGFHDVGDVYYPQNEASKNDLINKNRIEKWQ